MLPAGVRRAGGEDGFSIIELVIVISITTIVAGSTIDGLSIELVCALDTDERGHTTVFITIY